MVDRLAMRLVRDRLDKCYRSVQSIPVGNCLGAFRPLFDTIRSSMIGYFDYWL